MTAQVSIPKDDLQIDLLDFVGCRDELMSKRWKDVEEEEALKDPDFLLLRSLDLDSIVLVLKLADWLRKERIPGVSLERAMSILVSVMFCPKALSFS